MTPGWRKPSWPILIAAQAAALAVLLAVGSERLHAAFPSAARGEIFDFYQEWGSARNWLEGAPLYSHNGESLRRHLGLHFITLNIRYNAHPPPAVLLAAPFGLLSYDAAFALWNVLSLALFALCFWLFCREFKLEPPAWLLLPGLACLALYSPLTQQLQQGQLNAVLLSLLLGCWLAERRGQFAWAGAFLGLAASLKFFPAYLFLYFLLRRRWSALAAGALAFALSNALAFAAFGPEAYRDYFTTALPDVREFRCHVTNAALDGWWGKVFVGSVRERVAPLVEWPLVARLGSLCSILLVTLAAAWTILKAKGRDELDLAFGVTVTATLLVSPLTWDHSLLLLSPWLWLTWTGLPARIIPRCCFLAILLSFSLNHVLLWVDRFEQQCPRPLVPEAATLEAAASLGPNGPCGFALGVPYALRGLTQPLALSAQGADVLGLLGIPTYALAGLFLLQLWMFFAAAIGSRENPRAESPA